VVLEVHQAHILVEVVGVVMETQEIVAKAHEVIQVLVLFTVELLMGVEEQVVRGLVVYQDCRHCMVKE
jgi:hypothetical protein